MVGDHPLDVTAQSSHLACHFAHRRRAVDAASDDMVRTEQLGDEIVGQLKGISHRRRALRGLTRTSSGMPITNMGDEYAVFVSCRCRFLISLAACSSCPHNLGKQDVKLLSAVYLRAVGSVSLWRIRTCRCASAFYALHSPGGALSL
jgi:hypothetical protein